jgi:hypothetical protein
MTLVLTIWFDIMIFALYRGCRFRTMARLLSCEYDLTIPEMSRTSPQVIPLIPLQPSCIGRHHHSFFSYALFQVIPLISLQPSNRWTPSRVFLLGTSIRKHPVTVCCVSTAVFFFFNEVAVRKITNLFIKFAHFFAVKS